MKKCTLFFFALISLCMLNATAQTFQNIIGRPDSEVEGLSMAQDVYGNMLVAGTFKKILKYDSGDNYPLLISLNADGTVDKAAIIESLGGTISNSVNIAAVRTASGKPNGYIIALNYSYEIVVIRTNNHGVIGWSKKFSFGLSAVPVRILPVYGPRTDYLAGFYCWQKWIILKIP